MVAFGMFVNISETDVRARTRAQKLVNNACAFQICGSSAGAHGEEFFQRLRMRGVCLLCVVHSLGNHGNATEISL
jgi:hypothetical protein